MTLGHSSGRNDGRVLDVVTLLYVASIPFDILPVAGGRSFTGPLGLLLIVTWIISSYRRGLRINFVSSAGILGFLYLLWIICTAYWSVDPGSTIAALPRYLLQAPLVLILSNTLGHMWLRSLVALGCSTGVLGMAVLSRPADTLASGAAHLDGIDENATALVLAVGFAALIYVAMHFDGRRAVFLGLIAAETGVATLRTGSRSGAIAASVVLLVALLQLIRQRRMRSVLMFRTAAMLLLVCASFIWALNAGLLPQRVASLLNFGPVSDSGRSGIIDLYLTTFDHWALFGVGLNADAQYLFLTHSWYKNAHSMFWKTWIESGVVGLILIAAFLSVVIERGFRSVASQALILMAVPIFVFAITLGVLSTSVFWFVIALALAQRSEELRPAEPPPSGTLSAAAPRC